MSKKFNLAECIRDTVEQSDGIEFYNNYSGRGMYGRKCVGVVGERDQIMEMLSELINELIDEAVYAARVSEASSSKEEEIEAADHLCAEVQAAVRTLLNSGQDSMGIDVIVYWPSIAPLEESDEEDEE